MSGTCESQFLLTEPYRVGVVTSSVVNVYYMSVWEKEPWFVVFANFCGENIPHQGQFQATNMRPLNVDLRRNAHTWLLRGVGC